MCSHKCIKNHGKQNKPSENNIKFAPIYGFIVTCIDFQRNGF